MTGSRSSGQRRAAFLAAIAAAAMLWMPATAAADDAASLYQANAIVTGTDLRQRPWGFAQCLREVVVKVSGNPKLRDDPRTTALAEHPDPLITAFNYVDLMAHLKRNDDQGTYDRPHRLTVHFDPAKIDDVLQQWGEKPWRGARPAVVPVLLVQGPKPPPYVLSAEIPAGSEQRGSFLDRAAEFGMAARIPTDAELAAWGIAADRFPPPGSAEPDGKSGDAIVVGMLTWNESLPGWVGAWHFRQGGVDHSWGIRGVNYDAAFRDIVRGVMLLASGHGAPN